MIKFSKFLAITILSAVVVSTTLSAMEEQKDNTAEEIKNLGISLYKGINPNGNKFNAEETAYIAVKLDKLCILETKRTWNHENARQGLYMPKLITVRDGPDQAGYFPDDVWSHIVNLRINDKHFYTF